MTIIHQLQQWRQRQFNKLKPLQCQVPPDDNYPMNADFENNPQNNYEAAPASSLPAGFPRPVVLGAVAGGQAKLLMTMYQGRLYAPGCTPRELLQRWNICENLAQQLSVKALESKVGKRAHMGEAEILEQYLPRLIATNWTSEAEARWVIRRTGEMLKWPIPASAIEQT